MCQQFPVNKGLKQEWRETCNGSDRVRIHFQLNTSCKMDNYQSGRSFPLEKKWREFNGISSKICGEVEKFWRNPSLQNQPQRRSVDLKRGDKAETLIISSYYDTLLEQAYREIQTFINNTKETGNTQMNAQYQVEERSASPQLQKQLLERPEMEVLEGFSFTRQAATQIAGSCAQLLASIPSDIKVDAYRLEVVPKDESRSTWKAILKLEPVAWFDYYSNPGNNGNESQWFM